MGGAVASRIYPPVRRTLDFLPRTYPVFLFKPFYLPARLKLERINRYLPGFEWTNIWKNHPYLFGPYLAVSWVTFMCFYASFHHLRRNPELTLDKRRDLNKYEQYKEYANGRAYRIRNHYVRISAPPTSSSCYRCPAHGTPNSNTFLDYVKNRAPCPGMPAIDDVSSSLIHDD